MHQSLFQQNIPQLSPILLHTQCWSLWWNTSVFVLFAQKTLFGLFNANWSWGCFSAWQPFRAWRYRSLLMLDAYILVHDVFNSQDIPVFFFCCCMQWFVQILTAPPSVRRAKASLCAVIWFILPRHLFTNHQSNQFTLFRASVTVKTHIQRLLSLLSLTLGDSRVFQCATHMSVLHVRCGKRNDKLLVRKAYYEPRCGWDVNVEAP